MIYYNEQTHLLILSDIAWTIGGLTTTWNYLKIDMYTWHYEKHLSVK